MILIVSFAGNAHVERVTRHLTTPYTVIDQAWFPADSALTVTADADAFAQRFRLPGGEVVELGSVSAVWYRRLRPLTLDPALTDGVARLFAWSEANEALLGAFYSL